MLLIKGKSELHGNFDILNKKSHHKPMTEGYFTCLVEVPSSLIIKRGLPRLQKRAGSTRQQAYA